MSMKVETFEKARTKGSPVCRHTRNMNSIRPSQKALRLSFEGLVEFDPLQSSGV